MATRLPAHRRPPIAFAHRGARAHAPENTLEAFGLALRLGATGLESDVWVTADGEVVLDHDGLVGRRVGRRRRIAPGLSAGTRCEPGDRQKAKGYVVPSRGHPHTA